MSSPIAPFSSELAHGTAAHKYMRPNGETAWSDLSARVVKHPMDALTARAGRAYDSEREQLFDLINRRNFIPGGRYLYACGNELHQVQNCLLLRCADNREDWGDLARRAEMSLLTGAGIGVYWGDVRPNGHIVRRTGGTASGPVPKMLSTNEQGRAAVQGGDRRSAIWAGLPWFHDDVFWFIGAKDWPQYLRDAQAANLADPENNPFFGAPLDMTNISVCLDDAFFAFFEGRVETGIRLLNEQAPDWMRDGTGNLKFEYATKDWVAWARDVYWRTVDSMTQTGEPGFSVDTGDRWNEKLRNACTEIVSADDSDICNLGGINIANFDDVREFENAVRLGVLYLTAGTVYSHVPYERVAEVREKNRRLGLDILGVHEFLLKRGIGYGVDDAFAALDPYMAAYRRALEFANTWQDEAGLSLSVAATSGAPTGTRGIVAETTTGWEPVFAAAYKRTVITSKAHQSDGRTDHYTVDPTVSRLVRDGYLLPTDTVEDSYSLAQDYERRFKMQAYAQANTDQAISMTINLPKVMTDKRDRERFGETLYRYLPKLRGITVYPDGAISGQPITKVPLAEALGADAEVWESDEKCASGVCGI